MPQTEVAPQTQTAVSPQTAATTEATATTQGAPQPLVVKQPHSFATFSGLVTLAIVLILFCYGYFHIRRQKTTRPVDKQAGDEGED